jgi:hypothetical protein
VPRAIAINVAANTTLPGFRGPLRPDGSFEYVPIPEREPTDDPVPTYADLNLGIEVPADLRDRRVHLDPCFRGQYGCPEYTYGDEHGVKAGPLSTLSAGDWLLFYATLEPGVAGRNPPGLGGPTPGDAQRPDWAAPEWGAYLIGAFRLGVDAVSGEEFATLDPAERERFESNAHRKRSTPDAEVLVYGDPEESRLFERAIPLSTRSAGADANRLVTDLSADSGKGPWWRRPLRFDPDATAELLGIVEDRRYDDCLSAR